MATLPDYNEINKTLSGIKDRALSVQTSLDQFKNQSPGNMNPDLTGLQKTLTEKLTSALPSIKPPEDQEKTITEKFAERKKLAESGTEAQKKLIESQAETALGEAKQLGERELKTEAESRRGFATNTVAVRELEETGRKRILELTKARDELLLKADSAKADQLDRLITSEQEMITTARQNYLSNLTGLLGSVLQVAGFETPETKRQRELEIGKESALANIKTQYANIPKINEAKTFEEAIGLIGPEIKKDKDLERRIKEAQIARDYAATRASNQSVSGTRLPADKVVMLSDANFLPSLLDNLEITINDNLKLFGVISGRVPFSEDRLKIDAQLRAAAQTVGRFMEGGVLRKEDEEKYYRMLPQLTDLNPNVALSKLQGVREMLALKYNGYLIDFANSGYNVSNFTPVNFGQNQEKSLKSPSDQSIIRQRNLSQEIGELQGNMFGGLFSKNLNYFK